MAADFGRIAIGPGAFDQGPAGMRVAGFGDRPLATSLARWSIPTASGPGNSCSWRGLSKRVRSPQFGDEGDGHGELDATQGLEGLDHRAADARFAPARGVPVRDAGGVRCVR